MISRRDIIKDEIEKIAQVFGHFLAQLLGTDGNNPKFVAIGDVEEALKAKLDLDLKTILRLEDQALRAFLASHHFDTANLELFGDLLVALGKQLPAEDQSQATVYLTKGLQFYELADAGSDAFSMVLARKVEEVRGLVG